jgi:4-hydroxythreonine-4-phosphate dehydrogenase
MIVISVGCPAGIGPEVSVKALKRPRRQPCVLVGDEATIRRAAELCGVRASRFRAFHDGVLDAERIHVLQAGPLLTERDRRPGKPSRAAGAAQLAYVDAAYRLVRSAKGRALVTGPVNKAAIARSGAPGAARFRGHTEWLCARDGAKTSVMCFAAPKLVTSLATTHVPLAKVAARLSKQSVIDACSGLVELLAGLGLKRPRIVVCSLNPHAGEDELLGAEEERVIVPALRQARRRATGASLVGPIGAETAFRKTYAGEFDGVVAMYHDQATIPLKLIAFGTAVNVTMGLSIVRTSVDHGTGYDIAWQNRAQPDGMIAAVDLAEKLLG